MLQCVAVCCDILRCVAVLQCVLRNASSLFTCRYFQGCSVLQCVAVCCSVMQCVAVCCSMLQCVAVYCSVV